MIFKRRCEIARGKLDIAPLIDVVLLLLIFFMLSSSMILPSALKVNLPRSSVARPRRGRKVTVSISREGTIYWQGKPVDIGEAGKRFAELGATDPEITVVIEADRAALHGRVVEVMSLARSHGLSRLAIAAKRGGG